MVKHGGDIYSGGERLGDALEILVDYLRVSMLPGMYKIIGMTE